MRIEALRKLWERLRSASGRGAALNSDSFTDSELAIGRMVVPLLEELEEAKQTISRLAESARALERAVDAFPVPALILDGQGRLLTSNGSARKLFGGRAFPERLIEAAHRATREGAEQETAAFPHPDGGGRLLRIVPAELSEIAAGSEDSPSLLFLTSDAADRIEAVDEKTLISRFALTPTEGRVVRLVSRGLTNREAAAELNISIETVRTHVAHAYDKMGVSNRASLVGLAYRLRFGLAPRA